MTYRNKLLLKRALIALGILLVLAVVLAIIGFTYLGRYVVYAEDGAYFSFHSQAPQEEAVHVTQLTSTQVELIQGDSISADTFLGNESVSIPATDVKGVLVDFETLRAGTSLNALGVDTDTCNTLVLEMRKGGVNLFDDESVLRLIDRAESQELRLIALISCLDDKDYALSHRDMALTISGEALWMNDEGNYYLDPSNPDVVEYVAGLIHQLADMGFQEVILDKFSFPTTSEIIFDPGDSTRELLLIDAFRDLLDKTVSDCDIGLLIEDPSEGHQALEESDRLYVEFSEGSRLKSYVENHPDQYVVFITASHDTRFENYGKLSAQLRLDDEEPTESEPPEDDDE